MQLKKILFLSVLMICVINICSCKIYITNGNSDEQEEKKEDKKEETWSDIDASFFEYRELPNKTLQIVDTSFKISDKNFSIEIPKEFEGKKITEIGKNSFNNIGNRLVRVKIPSNIKYIDKFAFSSCEYLKEVVFEKGVEIIGAFAFCDCKNLTEINLPESLHSIGDGIFSECKNLKKIDFPATIDSIPSLCCLNCKKLSEVNINNGINRIEKSAFARCFELKELYIPMSVKYLSCIFIMDDDSGAMSNIDCTVKCARKEIVASTSNLNWEKNFNDSNKGKVLYEQNR